MHTYIVATVVANGNPEHPPQIDLWAARTTSKEAAESLIRSKIDKIEVLAITARFIDDGGANVFKMSDEDIKTL